MNLIHIIIMGEYEIVLGMLVEWLVRMIGARDVVFAGGVKSHIRKVPHSMKHKKNSSCHNDVRISIQPGSSPRHGIYKLPPDFRTNLRMWVCADNIQQRIFLFRSKV